MDRITYLLDRYVNNACTQQEMNELLDYVQQHPEDERLHLWFQKLWNEGLLPDDVDRSWTIGEGTFPDAKPREKRMSYGAVVWRVAAAFLVLAMCFIAFVVWRSERRNTPDTVAVAPRAVDTGASEHRLIVLADGSQVWLNNNSSISCDISFNETDRRVTLEGEAFFDIRRDPDRPFIIRTGSVTTTVLGTAFNIRAFPGEKVVTVTVTRGRVRVEDQQRQSQTITVNQQVRVNLETAEVAQDEVDATSVSMWTNEDLILDEVTLGEVEEILERRYSIDIRFDNALLADCRFTATFFHDASLDEILRAICLVNGASYEQSGDQVTIYGSGCNDNEDAK